MSQLRAFHLTLSFFSRFRHGFVHCGDFLTFSSVIFLPVDPHTANVLVRVRPQDNSFFSISSWWNYFFKTSPQAQIVLLDHGLYRQLDDKFRRSVIF